jgi:hypothetical protein
MISTGRKQFPAKPLIDESKVEVRFAPDPKAQPPSRIHAQCGWPSHGINATEARMPLHPQRRGEETSSLCRTPAVTPVRFDCGSLKAGREHQARTSALLRLDGHYAELQRRCWARVGYGEKRVQSNAITQH